jgi:hypothetical protein
MTFRTPKRGLVSGCSARGQPRRVQTTDRREDRRTSFSHVAIRACRRLRPEVGREGDHGVARSGRVRASLASVPRSALADAFGPRLSATSGLGRWFCLARARACRTGNWTTASEDGYDWSDGSHVSVRWMPGKLSWLHPHVIASDTEGEWQPDDGYD